MPSAARRVIPVRWDTGPASRASTRRSGMRESPAHTGSREEGHASRRRRTVTNAWLAAGLGAVAVLDIALLWVVLGPALARRLEERSTGRRDGAAGGVALDIRAVAALDPSSILGDGVPAAAYDRVVRVASWIYLLSTAAVIYATGRWPAAEDPLLLVLVIGGVFILVAHDLLPAASLGAGRFVVEGAVAITLVSIVASLTDGAASPFFYAYPLIVAGVALVVRPLVTLALAVVAIGGYLIAAGVAAGGFTPDPGSLATVAVNLTALMLLVYVAMVVAREQRRTREAAVRLSTIDALTGLANRGYIIAAVEREIDRATRYRRGFCLLMADVDGLKEVNDTYGHQVGDRALMKVADVIRENVRRMPAIGAPVQRRLIAVYTLSAAIAGVAGGLLAQTTQFVGLDVFGFPRSADLMIMLVLGGAGRLYGGLVGATVFMLAHHYLSDLNPIYWQFWLGLLLVVVVLYGRGGILGALDGLRRRLGGKRK